MRRFTVPRTAVLSVVLLVTIAGAGHHAAVLADSGTVSIQDFSFQPGNSTISAGDTLTWSNGDSVTHTVSADDGSFDSGSLATGDTASWRFDSAGSYSYHCNIHPFMQGTITVN